MNKLKKSEFVAEVASITGTPQNSTEEIINATFKVIADQMIAGNAVAIPGFGTFSVAERAARTGKNPHTNEPIEIPARTVPAFKATPGLKKMVNHEEQ